MRRLLTFFAGLVCLTVGAVAAMQATAQLVEAAGTTQWPQVTGIILASNVASGGTTRKWYEARISYQYSVGSQTYSGSAVSYRGGATGQALAEDLVRAFPIGDSAQVFYDPANPSRAYLRPGASWETALPVAVALAVVVGGTFMVLDARRGK